MTTKSPTFRKTSSKSGADAPSTASRVRADGTTEARNPAQATLLASDSIPEPSAAPAQRTQGDDFSREELRAVSEELAQRFPLGIEHTELVLMDVDPHQVHAYWNISYEDMTAARRTLGAEGEQALVVLRFYDQSPAASGAGRKPFDVVIQGLQGHRAVDMWADARRYVAELGLRRSDDTLLPLARSNQAQTPAARPAQTPKVPYREIRVTTQDTTSEPGPETGLPKTSGQPGDSQAAPRTTANLEPALRPGTGGMAPRFPQAGAGEASPVIGQEVPAVPAVGLGEAPVRPLPPETTAAVARQPEPARQETAPTQPAGDSPVESHAAGAPSTPPFDPTLGGPSDTLQPVFPATVGMSPRATGLGETNADAPSLQEGNQGEPLREPLRLGPSSPPSAPGSPVPLVDRIVTYSSATLAQQRTAELEINAELHIYGHARPGSELSLFGRPVALRPDGSFSIQRTLPEGAVVVPLVLTRREPTTPGNEGD